MQGIRSTPRGLALSTLAALSLCTTVVSGSQPNQPVGGWVGDFGLSSGCNGGITAAQGLADGTVLIGGNFRVCGYVDAPGLAIYYPDDGRFTSFPEGLPGNDVAHALEIWDGAIYAGGHAGLYRWTGSSFERLGQEVALVYALEAHGDQLAVAGSFKSGSGLRNVALWSGEGWSAMGDGAAGGTNSLVYTLHSAGDVLFVGGQFTEAGGVPASGMASWDGAGWTAPALGNPPTAAVTAILSKDGRLFYGTSQSLYVEQPAPAPDIVVGASGTIDAIVDHDGAVYAAGLFDALGGQPMRNVAMWTGAGWSAVGDLSIGYRRNMGVSGLVSLPGGLLAAGDFPLADGAVANGVAVWDGSDWGVQHAPGMGPGGGYVAAFVDDGEYLFAGGGFHTVGEVEAWNIARWDGGVWSQVGPPDAPGVYGTVEALAVLDGVLYAAGTPTIIGAPWIPWTLGVARFDGASWEPIAEETSVRALAVHQGSIYAGGQFASIGGVAAQYLARWNGAAWTPVLDSNGQGIGGEVTAIASFNGELYVGGAFKLAGGEQVNHVARFDGTQWLPLTGSGAEPGLQPGMAPIVSVNALLVDGETLHILGRFVRTDLGSANLLRWNGTDWLAGAEGLPDTAAAAAGAAYGGGLFVSGHFDAVGTAAVQSIAWHDARQRWESPATGGGTDWPPFAMHVFEDTLWVGGYLSRAGGQAASGIATLRLNRVFADDFD